jgi:hypothetical protein
MGIPRRASLEGITIHEKNIAQLWDILIGG